MYKIFDTLAEYNQYTDNGTHLTAGILYLVKENKSLYFLTNNIDGETEKYEYLDEIPEGYIKPEGNIIITENGEEIDISTYATASVNVPIPEGYIIPTGNKEITQNGTNIDVNDYATATVNVTPNLTTQNITENGTYQPSGNYDGFSSVTVAVPQPTGNISITENGTNIDIAQYATATVNVAGSAKDYIVEGAVYDPTATYSGEFKTINHITSATIPSGFTSIGSSTFKGCTSLTSVTIPNSVTSIGYSAFESCTSLTSVTIPNSVTSIGSQTFMHCNSLTSIDIPDSVTKISDNTFMYCNSLTSIDIPDSVTSINQYAFYECKGLTSITIPSGVTSIGSSTFQGCTSLTSVTIEATTPPTLGTNVFTNTNNCPIYVPAESLEAYKTATNWSSLSSRLQAIA